MTTYALIAPAQQWVDANGNPYVGAKLFTYSAGSTTKKTTYQDEGGVTPNANPIVLNSRGEASNGSATVGVWGSTGPYKLVLAPATDSDPPLTPYWTIDDVSGINDIISATPQQWIPSGFTPSYIGATQFSVPGDQTATFEVGRRIQATLGGGNAYGTITASSFGAGITTVTLAIDSSSGNLDNTISAVAYGFLSYSNPSVPVLKGYAIQAVEGTPYATYTDVSVVLPADDTIPQITEGAELVTVTITPKLATSRLRIEADFFAAIGTTGSAGCALFQDATADALASRFVRFAGTEIACFMISHEMAAGSVAQRTFRLRAGPSTAAVNLYINGSTTARLGGGSAAVRIRVTEFAA